MPASNIDSEKKIKSPKRHIYLMATLRRWDTRMNNALEMVKGAHTAREKAYWKEELVMALRDGGMSRAARIHSAELIILFRLAADECISLGRDDLAKAWAKRAAREAIRSRISLGFRKDLLIAARPGGIVILDSRKEVLDKVRSVLEKSMNTDKKGADEALSNISLTTMQFHMLKRVSLTLCSAARYEAEGNYAAAERNLKSAITTLSFTELSEASEIISARMLRMFQSAASDAERQKDMQGKMRWEEKAAALRFKLMSS